MCSLTSNLRYLNPVYLDTTKVFKKRKNLIIYNFSFSKFKAAFISFKNR